ncbi:chemotaxis protein CheD [Derxia lacustris]|uniref:chemotaxis protein CheD n=1 Tax=Derxia lacustris TaxID=764842 RepID=UPI000A170942|nr:chemotaxis protein CheD [Derxia lacustris]
MIATPRAPAEVGPVVTLHPGDVHCAERGVRLETLLGSCVAIVLTDPRRSLGAMCHVIHAGAPPAGATARQSVYGDVALGTMYRLLSARGIVPALCEAYVYGGGNMFPTMCRDRHVGTANIDWAFAALAQDGIALAGHDVGGTVYRRLGWTVGPDAPQVVACEV